MKRLYQVDEFFPAAGDERFTLSVTIGEDTESVFTAAMFADAAIYDYGERKILLPETGTPLDLFYGRFTNWKNMRSADIAKAYEAFYSEYDPIQNYNSEEKKTGTDTGLKTPTNWKETKDFKVSQDYKVVDSQKPTEWKETIEHSVSNDYKEVDSQKPTNWKETKDFKVSQDYKETESQKPNQWKETKDFKVSQDYKETDSEKPTNWKEEHETIGNTGDNNETTTNSIIPFNASSMQDVSQSSTDKSFRESTERSGTYDREHTQTGTKTEELSKSGTFDTEHTQTGTRTEETSTSGTYDTEHTQTGTKTEEKTTSGTFNTEHTQTGTRTEETAQTGTFEDKMTYNTTITKKGNIGVTTSQQMIESELELRRYQFVRNVIKEFFDMVTVYA